MFFFFFSFNFVLCHFFVQFTSAIFNKHIRTQSIHKGFNAFLVIMRSSTWRLNLILLEKIRTYACTYCGCEYSPMCASRFFGPLISSSKPSNFSVFERKLNKTLYAVTGGAVVENKACLTVLPFPEDRNAETRTVLLSSHSTGREFPAFIIAKSHFTTRLLLYQINGVNPDDGVKYNGEKTPPRGGDVERYESRRNSEKFRNSTRTEATNTVSRRAAAK